ncbi:PRTRC system protein E [Emticicia sp. TH156]|uniref:PRTRC system protein E n=1 Tax=Emticicia sp. TH156 TaxID=2067454 RepID=UPI000C7863E1|nr:PRTRC system protein E [Emticicia sp. TH156]PLK44873.1 prtrc system protein e [Emticicia sp. TH156]
MNANFFNQLARLDITGNLQLTIAKGADSTLVVSMLLQPEPCGDEAGRLIPPLNLRGTADELDNGFFEKITLPMQTASGLLVNMEVFMKQLEEAKKHSAMEKDKTDKEKKAREEADKKYKESMQKVEELEKEGKYREAWMRVPNPLQFPEQGEVIRKRKASLSAKFAPDLFGTSQTASVETRTENSLFNPDKEEDVSEDNGEYDNEEE